MRVEAEVSRDLRGASDGELLKLRVLRRRARAFRPEDLKRVFRPFVRLDDDTVEGSGLGLTLVRSLVDMCDGDVSVRSESGQGHDCVRDAAARAGRGHRERCCHEQDREWDASIAAVGDESVEHSLSEIHRAVRLLRDGVRRAFPRRLHVPHQPDGRAVPRGRACCSTAASGCGTRWATRSTGRALRRNAALLWYSSYVDLAAVVALIYLTGTIESPFLFMLTIPLFFVCNTFSVEDDGGVFRLRVAGRDRRFSVISS